MKVAETHEQITLRAGMTPRGSVSVISSKSELHRLIICACMAHGKTVITYNSSLSEDIQATVSCLKALGAQINISEKEITVEKPLDIGYIKDSLPKDTEIFCRESGSTARFLLPFVSLFCRRGAVMTGTGKLPSRPFSDLCTALSQKGAVFSSENMPIHIEKTAIPEGDFEISGNISSQYLSGLLFVLPLCENARIKLTTPLSSRGYVDMTIEAMGKFGVKVEEKNGIYTCRGKYTNADGIFHAGGDWSNSAFFLCAANSEKITVNGIDPHSLQPDRAVMKILSDCGINVEFTQDRISVTRCGEMFPLDINVEDTPDLVPVLCVLAASAKGKSVLKNVQRLRFKESDRILAVCEMINALGGCAYSDGDNIYIEGTGTLAGGMVDGFGDHRIVMSAAIAAQFCTGDVTIKGADAVSKSYPEFFDIFYSLTEEK
ncbi:MAG: 3-phosphoshikimate 1-carboxyvinyltransferase [Clostridia bacterium]|nr:3-phosphoshikimate 1-carboxyvinyltransferase [Clostridia bacterium]